MLIQISITKTEEEAIIAKYGSVDEFKKHLKNQIRILAYHYLLKKEGVKIDEEGKVQT